MRFVLELAVVMVMVSPLVGMLAGHLWARANRHNPTPARTGRSLTSS
jgi:hypothetical protein